MVYDERPPMTPAEIRNAIEKLLEITKKLQQMIDIVDSKTNILQGQTKMVGEELSVMAKGMIDMAEILSNVVDRTSPLK